MKIRKYPFTSKRQVLTTYYPPDFESMFKDTTKCSRKSLKASKSRSRTKCKIQTKSKFMKKSLTLKSKTKPELCKNRRDQDESDDDEEVQPFLAGFVSPSMTKIKNASFDYNIVIKLQHVFGYFKAVPEQYVHCLKDARLEKLKFTGNPSCYKFSIMSRLNRADVNQQSCAQILTDGL